MIKITKRFLSVILVISICGMWLCPISVNAQSIGQAITSAQIWTQLPNGTTVIDKQAFYNLLNMIYGFLYGIAIALTIVHGIFIGMRMILGTLEERVDAKAMLGQYILIAFGIAFGGVILRAILGWIISLIP